MLTLNSLEGRWYINLSNFPMWLKGDKTSPTFNYAVIQKPGGAVLSDSVEYFQHGKTKSINGIDFPQDKNNTVFVWRGKGLLKLLKSKWQILYFDAENQWAIIYFEKTLFTPKGYDVISRNAKLTDEHANAVLEKLKELGIDSKLHLLK